MRTQKRHIKQLKTALHYLLFMMIAFVIMITMIIDFGNKATDCDKELGHTCSINEIQNHGRGIYGK